MIYIARIESSDLVRICPTLCVVFSHICCTRNQPEKCEHSKTLNMEYLL